MYASAQADARTRRIRSQAVCCSIGQCMHRARAADTARAQQEQPSVDAFHGECNALATTDTQRGEAFLGPFTLHAMQQGCHYAGTRGADWVTDRDCAAGDVDPCRIPAQVLVDRHGLRREGFVGLDAVEVRDRPAGLLEAFLRGRDRTGAHEWPDRRLRWKTTRYVRSASDPAQRPCQRSSRR